MKFLRYRFGICWKGGWDWEGMKNLLSFVDGNNKGKEV